MQRNVEFQLSIVRSKRKWRAMKNTEVNSNRNVCISTLRLMQMRLCCTRTTRIKKTQKKLSKYVFRQIFMHFSMFVFIAVCCKSCLKQACEHRHLMLIHYHPEKNFSTIYVAVLVNYKWIRHEKNESKLNRFCTWMKIVSFAMLSPAIKGIIMTPQCFHAALSSKLHTYEQSTFRVFCFSIK